MAFPAVIEASQLEMSLPTLRANIVTELPSKEEALSLINTFYERVAWL